LIGNILSINIGGIIGEVFDILMVAGAWLVYVNGRKRKLSTTGISLIRIPYVISFIFTTITSVFTIIANIVTLNVFSFLSNLILLIVRCIFFSSINNTLKMARDVNRDQTVIGRKAGSFAAIITIVFAVFNLISSIATYLAAMALAEVLGGNEFTAAIMNIFVGSVGVMTLVAAGVTFLTNIAGALVLLQFGKKVKGN
jgi:hypothetical protein